MKKSKKILLVDDDSSMIKVLEKWLGQDGYSLISALSGKHALERIQDEGVDCILLDLMIPGMDGISLARELKKHPNTKGTPIIFITATMGVENDAGDEKLDVDGVWHRVFAKPLHKAKLLSSIRKAINLARNSKK